MRLRTRSLIIVLSQGVSQAALIVLAIALVRMLSQEAFGTFQQVFLVYLFLVGVLGLQLDASLYYFLPKLDVQSRRGLVVQTSVMTLAVSALIGAVMFLGAPLVADMMHNPHLVGLLRIFSLYPFADRLAALVPAFMISVDRAGRAAVFTMVLALGRVGAAVAAVGFEWGLVGAFGALLVFTSLVAAAGVVDMLRLSPVGSGMFRRDLMVQQLHYTWPIWATAIVDAVNVRFDKLLISSFFDPASYAVYSCGAFELPVVFLITSSLATAMMPDMVKMADEGRKLDALRLWQEGARKCSLVIFPCFVFFLLTGPDVIVLLYGQKYSMAAWPFGVYLVMLPVRITVYNSIFRAIGHTRPVAVSAVIGLVSNVILSTGLTWVGGKSLLGFVGPGVGIIAANLLMVAYLLRTLGRIMNIPVSRVMRWKELAMSMLLAMAAAVPVILLPLDALGLVGKLAVRAGAFLLLLLLLWWKIPFLRREEKQLLALPFRLLLRLGKRGGEPGA